MVPIRKETTGDIPAVHALNEKAFERPEEAEVVDKLREFCEGTLSLVAEVDGQIVGHILFSPVAIEAEQGTIQGMGLAPMAVLPKYQRQGIGSALVNQGLAMLRGTTCPFVIVLGHRDFYPRFGFQPASNHGIRCQWDGVPDAVFMAIILDESGMADVGGVARYRPEFDDAM